MKYLLSLTTFLITLLIIPSFMGIGICEAQESCLSASGENYCGKKSAGACWCDDLCVDYGDCCEDKKKICDNPNPPNPDPKPNPSEPYCYEENLFPNANVSDIKSGYTETKWRQSLLKVLERRYPSGYQLMYEMKDNQYLEQFAKQSSYVKLVSNFYISVHEMTHMWDLNQVSGGTSLKSWIRYNWKPKVDTHGGFPRSEILGMIEGSLSSSMDDTYLKGEQGTYKFEGILAELNAYINGLSSTGMFGEDATDFVASSSKDNAITSMYYTILYLKRARTAHSSFYDQIKSTSNMKEMLLIQWLRLHYFLKLTDKFPHLGSNTQAHLTRLHQTENIKELEMFTGHKLHLENRHCVAMGDTFKPPFQP